MFIEAAQNVDIVTITSPVGPYFKEGLKPIRLYADTENARAWPGGCGNAKVRNPAPLVELKFMTTIIIIIVFIIFFLASYVYCQSLI